VIEPSAAAATGTVTSTTVDMKGYDACTFLCKMADVLDTSVLTATVHHSDSSASGFAATDLTCTFTAGASDADDLLLALECTYPTKRYLRFVLTIGTADAALSGVIAIQTMPGQAPVTQSADVIASSQGVAPATA
jgi:hypothetical protein